MTPNAKQIMNNANFVFFGTPYVARDTLAALVDAGHTPSLVVTNPDAPRGRGHILTPSETKVFAEAHNIPVITPEKIDEATIERITAEDATLGICVAYGSILPEKLIESFPLGILNVHYSLLPKYRGATPTEAALLHGDSETGVTIQKMVKELDAGDIVAQESTVIGESETTQELRPRLIEIGSELLIKTLPRYIDGYIEATLQDHSQATRCGKLKKEDGLLDLTAPAKENWNKYRAYKEWPGTYFFTNRNDKQVRIKITEATLQNNEFVIKRIVPEGKKEMAWEQYFG